MNEEIMQEYRVAQLILLLTLSAVKSTGNDTFLLHLSFLSFFEIAQKKVYWGDGPEAWQKASAVMQTGPP